MNNLEPSKFHQEEDGMSEIWSIVVEDVVIIEINMDNGGTVLRTLYFLQWMTKRQVIQVVDFTNMGKGG